MNIHSLSFWIYKTQFRRSLRILLVNRLRIFTHFFRDRKCENLQDARNTTKCIKYLNQRNEKKRNELWYLLFRFNICRLFKFHLNKNCKFNLNILSPSLFLFSFYLASFVPSPNVCIKLSMNETFDTSYRLRRSWTVWLTWKLNSHCWIVYFILDEERERHDRNILLPMLSAVRNYKQFTIKRLWKSKISCSLLGITAGLVPIWLFDRVAIRDSWSRQCLMQFCQNIAWSYNSQNTQYFECLSRWIFILFYLFHYISLHFITFVSFILNNEHNWTNDDVSTLFDWDDVTSTSKKIRIDKKIQTSLPRSWRLKCFFHNNFFLPRQFIELWILLLNKNSGNFNISSSDSNWNFPIFNIHSFHVTPFIIVTSKMSNYYEMFLMKYTIQTSYFLIVINIHEKQ